MSRTPTLKQSELCDLVNYLFGLPVRMGRHIAEPRIEPVVVSSWTAHTRARIEDFCDRQLRPPSPGHRSPASLPATAIPELARVIPFRRRIA